MDAVKVPVNWSAVAAQAFEAKLLELESKKNVSSMEDVIARLKAAAEIEANEKYQAGFEAGDEWARKQATPSQLRRMAEYIGRFPDEGVDWFHHDPGDFAQALLGLGDDRRGEVWDFWNEAVPHDEDLDQFGEDRILDADLFRGFGDGAVALWEKVMDKL
jgi:hypothetical protein